MTRFQKIRDNFLIKVTVVSSLRPMHSVFIPDECRSFQFCLDVCRDKTSIYPVDGHLDSCYCTKSYLTHAELEGLIDCLIDCWLLYGEQCKQDLVMSKTP